MLMINVFIEVHSTKQWIFNGRYLLWSSKI